MAKVRFTKDMIQKPVTKTGDFLMVFDGEETDITKQVKFTPDIPKMENETQDIETGLLYNWYAVNTGKLAPTGYRVASDDDFTTLVNYLISQGFNYDGTTSGNKLGKSVCIPFGWASSDIEGAVGNDSLSSKYNTTRFTMVNTKRRESNGSFNSLYEGSPVWTTTEAGSNAYYRHVGGGSIAAFNQNDGNKKSGYGVRCLRDATASEQLLADGTFLEDVTDLSGNTYNTVKLGTQVWFRQNLKTTKYNDNTDITNVTSNSSWGALTTEAYCSYNNEPMVVFEVEDYLYVKPKENKLIKSQNVFYNNSTGDMTVTEVDSALNTLAIRSRKYNEPVYHVYSGYLFSDEYHYNNIQDVFNNVIIDTTFVANTTNGSTTVNIVSGTNFSVGKMVFGSGIPYGTYITAVGVGTLTLSNAATATANGVTLTRRQEIWIKVYGTVKIDSSIEMDGVFWDFTGATLIVGNATAFNITSVKNSDFVVRGGKWLKIHANSKIIANNTTQQGALYYSGDIPIDETSNRFANYYIQTNESLHSNLFIFENSTNIGNIATTYDFTPATKINRATVTGNVVITLPTYPSSQSVSVMLKLTQGGAGGYDIIFQDAINLSQFVFTDGTVGQRTWVTLLWDGEEWCFTASAWKDAV